MWIGVLSIVLLLVIIVLVCCSNIKIDVTLQKHNHDEEINVRVSLFYGLASIKYKIPAIKFRKWKEGLKLESQKTNNFFNMQQENQAETQIDKEKVEGWLQRLERMIRATFGLKKWLLELVSKIKINQLSWSTQLAVSDAAYTATLVGLLWGVKSSIIGFLSYHLILREHPQIDIVPVFGSAPVFFTKFHCIAKIRCGYAIYAVLVLMFRVLKVKGGMKKWLSILFKG